MTTAVFSVIEKPLTEPQIAGDLGIDDLVLDWVSLSADLDVRGAVVDASLERTMSGASTLTLELLDPDGQIFRKTTLWIPAEVKKQKKSYDEAGEILRGPQARGRVVECEIDGIPFRLVKVSKSGNQLTLVFEDRAISWLRQKKGTKRGAARSSVTRAQFLLALLREVQAERIPFVCPELSKRQPQDSGSSSTDDDASAGGFGSARLFGQDATGARYPMTSSRVAMAARVMRIADDCKAGPKPRVALAEACNVESKWADLPGGHSSSVGLLQLLDLHGSVKKRRDVDYIVRRFLLGPAFSGGKDGAIALAKKNPSWPAHKIAQAVQASAFTDGSNYAHAHDAALHTVEAWGGGGNVAEASAAGAGSTKGAQTYRFERAKNEDSWTAMTRLAAEVGWRLFMRGRSMVFMSEEDLYRQPVRMTIGEDEASILSLDFDVDWGKTASEITAEVIMRRWDAPPGTCVEVDGWGVINGRWLVESVTRNLFEPIAEVRLRQPSRSLLEPAPEAASSTSTSISSGAGPNENLTGAKAKARKVFEELVAISGRGYPYVWGGGHSHCGRADGGTGRDPGIGFDCSGYTAAGLAVIGAGIQPGGQVPGSGSFGGLPGMEPGRGKYLTIYYNPTHVWMGFEAALGVSAKRADTSPQGSGTSGPRVRYGDRTTSGFNMCHPKGL